MQFGRMLRLSSLALGTLLQIKKDNMIIKINSFINSHNVNVLMSPKHLWYRLNSSQVD